MNEKIKILMIEDNRGYANLTAEISKEIDNFEIDWVERLSEGIELIRQKKYNVVLLDLSLPDSNGQNTFFKVAKICPTIPIIIMSGFDDDEFASYLLEKGAHSYIVKQYFTSEEWEKIITQAIQDKKDN